MKELLDKVFQNIQNLHIQPTEENVMLLADCLIALKRVYAMIPEEKESEVKTDV